MSVAEEAEIKIEFVNQKSPPEKKTWMCWMAKPKRRNSKHYLIHHPTGSHAEQLDVVGGQAPKPPNKRIHYQQTQQNSTKYVDTPTGCMIN
jgi:hypothetical protein